jgi:hypothetical protein
MYIGRALKLARKITKKVLKCIYKTKTKVKLFKTLRVEKFLLRRLTRVNS